MTKDLRNPLVDIKKLIAWIGDSPSDMDEFGSCPKCLRRFYEKHTDNCPIHEVREIVRFYSKDEN